MHADPAVQWGHLPYAQQVVLAEPTKNTTNAQLTEMGAFKSYGANSEQKCRNPCGTKQTSQICYGYAGPTMEHSMSSI